MADTGAQRASLTLRTYTVVVGDSMQRIATQIGASSRRHWFGELRDANPHKTTARGMMRMVGRLNKDLPGFAGKDAHVTCYTCHRGSPHPATVAPMPTAPLPATPLPTPAS